MLKFLRRQGLRRGVLGTSRPWLAVWAAISTLSLVRRLLGRKQESVFKADLQPGEIIVIAHERDIISVEERGKHRSSARSPGT